jgi:hypothetical protein
VANQPDSFAFLADLEEFGSRSYTREDDRPLVAPWTREPDDRHVRAETILSISTVEDNSHTGAPSGPYCSTRRSTASSEGAWDLRRRVFASFTNDA